MQFIVKKDLEKRIGFEFPQKAFEDIPFKANYLPHEKELINKSLFFVKWGHAIIQTVFGLYLYLEEPNLNKNRYNTFLKSSITYIENKIYKQYKLNTFIITSGKNNNGNFPEIVSKLMVLIYMGHGFERLLRFLKPYLQDCKTENEKNISYIIERYADALNMEPVYKYDHNSGLNNKNIYGCTIIIGDRKASSMDEKKDAARYKAEQSFVNKYRNNIQKRLDEQIEIQSPAITEQRKKDLYDAISKLQKNNSYITINQMDQVLTHPSFKNSLLKQDIPDNSILSSLGNQILKMLNFEFIYRNNDLSQITSFNGKELTHEKALSDFLSDNYLNYLLYSKQKRSDDQINIMKEEVFLGILASYWLNYVSRQDRNIGEFAKNNVFLRLCLLDKRNRTDFYKLLKYISKIYEWKISAPFTVNFTDANNKNTYLSRLSIDGTDWTKKDTGRAYSEKEAVKAAVKKLLPQIMDRCSDDIVDMIKKVILVPPPPLPPPPPPSPPTPQPKPQPKPLTPTFNVPFDGTEYILYICNGKSTCQKYQHEIIPATGLITKIRIDGKTEQVRINIHYCQRCNKYFIGLESYKSYQEKHGMLLGNYIFENFSSTGRFGFEGLAKDSPLSLCGYSVEQRKGLSKYRRREILEYIMNHDILDKPQVINYLEFFIYSHKNMPAAIEKWKDDLDWVNKYKINQQIHVAITKIKKKMK